MCDARAAPGAKQSGADLHETSGVPRSDDGRPAARNVLELHIEYARARFRLDQIVDARAAAAVLASLERQQLESGDGAEHAQRWLAEALRLPKVARGIVGDRERPRGDRLRSNRRQEH